MKSIIEVVATYGTLSKPAVNYVLSLKRKGPLSHYLRSIKLRWERKHQRVLEEIKKGLRKSLDTPLRYLLLSQMLKVIPKNSIIAENLRKKLLKELHKISPEMRIHIMPAIFNVSVLNESSLPRRWSDSYERNLPALIFLIIASAREEAKKGNIVSAVSRYRDAYRKALSIPHPSGMIASLNDIAWYIKDRHPKMAKRLADYALFIAGFYRENVQIYALDTLFEVEKIVKSEDIVKTARIIVMHSSLIGDKYSQLLLEAKKLIVNEKRLYENSAELSNYLQKIIKSVNDAFRKTGIARDNLSKIINRKIKRIKGNTLEKLIEGLSIPLDLNAPEGVLKEKARMILDRMFEISMEKLSKLSVESREKLFVITSAAQMERKYLSRKDKFREAFELLKDISTFGHFMSRKLETVLFVIDMTNAHPFVEGRKTAVKKVIGRIHRNKFEKFTREYVDLSDEDRKVFDRFLRNYGRYEGINLGINLKGADEVRSFAGTFDLAVQPSFAAYWCEDDGRIRKRLGRILIKFAL